MSVAETLKERSIGDVARLHYAQANGDKEAAIKTMIAGLRNDPDLLRQCAAKMIDMVSAQAINSKITSHRAMILQANIEKSAEVQRNGRERVMTLGRAFLDWPMDNGRPLRSATREMLSEQASAYFQKSETFGKRGKWFQLLGQSVPDGRTVGEVLTEKRVKELWEEANG